jgi:outer membrane protein TolC
MRAPVVASLVALSAPALAADLSVLDRFAGEPSVRELQCAAMQMAEVHPERARSWLHRAGTAAVLPTVRARVGRGLGELSRDGSGEPVYTMTNDWRFEVEATWSLDRLVFDRNELRAGREAQRLAAHREELLTRVAQLYYARRRLQVDAVLQPEAPGAIDRALEIAELTAVLDGLTDGALTRGRRSP